VKGKIVAVADLFPEQAKRGNEHFDVHADKCFSGFDAYKKVLEVPGVNYAILATPPGFRPIHFEYAIQQGKHVFMEKPVSHSPDGVPELVDLLEQRGLVGMTAFCMRFFKPLRKAKELLDAGRIGRLVTARSFTGAYLPDWHPWEDYRTFYMSKKDQGGGVLLDECHAFDWMQWLCGPITGVCAVAGTFSDLEVDSDDVCEVVARFGDRAVGSIHLDMVDRSIRTQVELIGTTGTVLVDLREHTVRAWEPEARRWETFTSERSYDQMYVEELDHFFDCVDRGTKPVVDLREGYQIQRVIDACARSNASGRWVAVD